MNSLLRRLIRTPEVGVVVACVLVVVAITVAQPRFASVVNLQVVGRDLAQYGTLAVGESLVILTGGIDLSVGALVAFTGVFAAWLNVDVGLPAPIAMLATVVLAGLVGLAHGLFVTRLDVPPFVITLVTYTVAQGAALALTTGFPVTGVSPLFGAISQTNIALIPVPTLLFVVIALAAWFFLERTYLGREVYAVGGNREASRLAGIRTSRRIVGVYVASAALAGVVGILVTGRLGVGEPSVAVGWELTAIAAAVIGGVSLFGGQGRILGIVAGGVLLVAINNGLVVLQVSPYYQQIVLGAVLGVAITTDRLRARRTAQRDAR